MVKWDYPATLVFRLRSLPQSTNIFFPPLEEGKNDHENSITIGFKILSAIYHDGIKKEDIEKLSYNTSINWEGDIERIITNFKHLFKILATTDYFKYFIQWKQNIRSLLSDAVLINYLVILYKDAERKNLFNSTGSQTNKFKKNAFILIDQLIYEYVCRYWRGSSDGRIAGNLKEFESAEDIFKPLDVQKWLELLHEINDEYKIQGVPIKAQREVAPVLFHFYWLSEKSTHSMPAESYEIDHIIPQATIDASTIALKDNAKHALFNLALLPPELNRKKKDKVLSHSDLTSADKGSISFSTDIPEDRFEEFSSPSNFEQLKAHRMKLFIKAFTEGRNGYLA